MRYSYAFILLFPCLCAAPGLFAQRTAAVPSTAGYIFRNINNDDGLTSNEVLAITQDSRGYLWIGSPKGLQRYDGLRFLDCPQEGNDQGDLGITMLLADTAGRRVLYTQNDFRLYQWDFLQHRSELVPVPPSRTYRDHKGNSWQIASYRADLYSIQKNGQGPVHAAHFFSDGKDCWLNDPSFGLYLLDTVRREVYTADDNPVRHPLLAGIIHPEDGIHGILPDHHGNLWLYTWGHLFYRYELTTHRVHVYSLADIVAQEGNTSTLPAWVSTILEDNHGVLWMATGKAGLLQYDTVKDRFRFITAVPNSTLSLQYNHQINAMFQDREENIWLATDRGISLFNPYRSHFTRLHGDEASPLLTNSTEICTAIQTRAGELWVGRWGGGISLYDTGLQATRHLFFKNQYDYNLVWSLLEQPDGEVWAGCQKGVLHKIDAATLATRTFAPPELESSTVRSLVHDKKGNTLFGLQCGKIIIWDPASKRFLPFADSGLPLSPIENLYVDQNNRCWASTRAGLQEFDIATRSFTGIYRPMAKNAVYCKGVDAWDDSTLIVGTENAGLYFFDRTSHRFRRIPVNGEQPITAASAVKKDSLGNIWYSGDYNINCYNPRKNLFAAWRPEKGLINDAFRATGFLPTRGGQWFTWTGTDLLGFYPAFLRSLQQKPGVVTITGFKVFANPLPIDSLLHTGAPVRLAWQQNFISIEFADLRYAGTTQPSYFYRLDGVDVDWVYGGTRGYAGYTGLPPGKYLFHVKAGNDSPETRMALHISAPYWATTWFRLLCAAIVILVAAGLIRWYSRGVRQEAGMKQQLAQSEMMALRAQMNPHFIFNCINSIDALIQTDDKYLATVSLNKFASLIRSILDSSQ